MLLQSVQNRWRGARAAGILTPMERFHRFYCAPNLG